MNKLSLVLVINVFLRNMPLRSQLMMYLFHLIYLLQGASQSVDGLSRYDSVRRQKTLCIRHRLYRPRRV